MAFGDCVSLLRVPGAANPHVRFDERGVGAAMLDDVPVVESTAGGIAQIPPYIPDNEEGDRIVESSGVKAPAGWAKAWSDPPGEQATCRAVAAANL